MLIIKRGCICVFPVAAVVQGKVDVFWIALGTKNPVGELCIVGCACFSSGGYQDEAQ